MYTVGQLPHFIYKMGPGFFSVEPTPPANFEKVGQDLKRFVCNIPKYFYYRTYNELTDYCMSIQRATYSSFIVYFQVLKNARSVFHENTPIFLSFHS